MKLTEAKLKSLINQVIKESQNNPTQFEEGFVAEALEFCQNIAESVDYDIVSMSFNLYQFMV